MGPHIRWTPEEEGLLVNLALTERTHIAPSKSVTQDWHDLTELLFNQPEMFEYRAACFVKFNPADGEEKEAVKCTRKTRTQYNKIVARVELDVNKGNSR
jgi:hypothetical protein